MHARSRPFILSPTFAGAYIVEELPADAAVGQGWSNPGVQYLDGYGYVHGGCATHGDSDCDTCTCHDTDLGRVGPAVLD